MEVSALGGEQPVRRPGHAAWPVVGALEGVARSAVGVCVDSGLGESSHWRGLVKIQVREMVAWTRCVVETTGESFFFKVLPQIQ